MSLDINHYNALFLASPGQNDATKYGVDTTSPAGPAPIICRFRYLNGGNQRAAGPSICCREPTPSRSALSPAGSLRGQQAAGEKGRVGAYASLCSSIWRVVAVDRDSRLDFIESLHCRSRRRRRLDIPGPDEVTLKY